MSDQESHTPLDDAQAMLKSFWGSLNIPLPGMVTPTLDVDELDKRITDMKAVEGWLKMNLNMLQMSIQGLEMQKFTLSTMKQAMTQAQESGEGANAFTNAALWPWNFMQSAAAQPTAPTAAPAPAAAEEKPAAAKKKA